MTGINSQLHEMIAQKKLTKKKVILLKQLKETVDRLSQVNFISTKELKQLEKKFDSKPDIITWGDYFQTEVAEAHRKKTDKEFETIVHTILFDIIASIFIFTNKPQSYLDKVEQNKFLSQGKNFSNWQICDEENLHLGILKDYYTQMFLSIENLTQEDFYFFNSYASFTKAS